MNYTPVHNRFWSDGWVRQLNALDRYLFLYLLTNGRALLTGIYELPLDLMASESGIDQRDLQVMLSRLEPKVYYREGWVILINYPKHHIGGGHKFNQGIKAQFNEIPPKIRDLAKGYGYPIDTLSMGYKHFPNRIEENRLDTSAYDAPIVEVAEEPKAVRAPRRDASVLEVFKAFGSYPKIWEVNVTQRKAAKILFDEYGIEQVKKMLKFYRENKEQPHIPVIDTPWDMANKWHKIFAFKEKNNL